ncbi:MAG: mannonate dehydratase [Lachnospiraceae bacterium]|nr:mannonate dehydratase [Lachnospiraceae bacterium]
MQMSLRWYGQKDDSVTLEQIRQIPGVKGIVSALHHIPAGEAWPYDEVMKRKNEIEAAGLKWLGVESINVHEDIKLGKPSRDKLIDNYIESLENVGKADVHLVCYNFMPVFDWTRTDLAKVLEDGSNTLAYDGKVLEGINVKDMFARIESGSNGFLLPGWEANRKDEIMRLFEEYQGMTADKLFENYKYFLDRIMPTCEKWQIKMAVHPDDPAWNIFGLVRIVTSEEALLRIARLNPSKMNGFTLCTGSLGSNRKQNDLVKIIRNKEIAERIYFAHLRNMHFNSDSEFYECAHLSSEGEFDMYEIVKALVDGGFDGLVRPDHGRMIWGEQARPGYGLYDRALGATYLAGLFEAVEKQKR